MSTLLKKVKILTDDLRESDGVRKQNFSTLATREGDKIVDYCALGALGCVKRLIYVKKQGSCNVKVEPVDYDIIIQAYGLSPQLTKPTTISFYRDKDTTRQIGVTSIHTFPSLITTLNDAAHYTFTDIAILIESLARDGYIKECDRETELKALQDQRALNDAEIKAKYEGLPDL